MPEVISGRKSSYALGEEVEMPDIRQSELDAAQNEFFNVRDEIRTMLDTLTLVQLQKTAEKLRDIVNGFAMNQ